MDNNGLVDGTNNLYAVWTPNANTPYTVEYYYQNDDGKTYPTAPTRTFSDRTGTTGTPVSVTAEDKADKENGKYVYDESAANIESATLAGDGSTVLKLYFKLNTVYYHVFHYLKGTTVSVAATQFGVGTIGKTASAKPVKSGFLPGFETAKADSYDPANNSIVLVPDPNSEQINKIIVYYTVPLTLKAQDASKTYDGEPLTQPGFDATGLVNDDTKHDISLSMTADSTITDVGDKNNVIDEASVKLGGKALTEYSYYDVTYQPGKLTVNKITEKTITITAASDSKTYDGQPLTNNDYTFTEGVLVDGDLLTAVVEGSVTNVGDSPADNVVTSYKVMRGDVDVTKNYTFAASVNGKLTINPRDVTFTGESDTLSYTGKVQSLTDITVAGLVDKHTYDGLTYEAKGQNVGEYSGKFTGKENIIIKDAAGADVTGNYNIKTNPGKLIITKAQFVAKFIGESAEKVYNGKEQEITGITVTGLKDGHEYTGLSYRAAGKDVGGYDGAFTGEAKIVDASGVDVTENYAITQTPGKLTITKANIKDNVTLKTADEIKVYDGESHETGTATATDANNNVIKIEYSVDGVNWTTNPSHITEKNVSKITVQVRATSEENYTGTLKGTQILKITPRPVQVSAVELKYAYDYASPVAHPADSVLRYVVEAASGDRGLLTGDTLTVDVLYADRDTQTLVGEYTAKANPDTAKIENKDGDVTTNYAITYEDGLLTITGDKLDPEKKTTSTTETNYNVGDKITYTITVKNVSKDEAKNVIVKDDMAEILDGEGYTVSTDKHTATITSIPAGGQVLVYAKHTVTAEDVEKAVKETNGTLTNVANITFGDWSKDVEGDHDKLNDTYSYTVHYYWNNAKNADGTPVSVAPDKTVPNATVNSKVTEAPITIPGFTPVSTASQTLTVKATVSENVITFYYYKNVELTANSATKTYDGTEKSVSGFTITGEGKIGDETVKADFSAITVGAKGTNAGTYPAEFKEGTVGTVDKKEHYIVTKAVNGKLVISPIANKITITANDDSKTYDGTPLMNSGYTFTEGVLVKGDILTAVVEGSATNVGDPGVNKVKSYKVMRGEEDVTGSYTFEPSVDGKLTITPRKVTLTSETASKPYDGQPLTAKTVTESGDGFIKGEGADYDVTGSQTVKGRSPNTFTYGLKDGTKEANYTIETEFGELEVTAGNIEEYVTLTPKDVTEKYDGEAHATGTATASDDFGNEFKLEYSVDGENWTTDPAEITATDVSDSKTIQVRASSDKNYTGFVYGKQKLTITPRPVTFTGETDTKVYNGKEQKITGITVSETAENTGLVNGHTYSGLTYEAKGTNVNTYDGVFGGELVIEDASGNDVTANYAVTKTPGKLTITKAEKAKVKITGNTATVPYTGSEQKVTGYEISNPDDTITVTPIEGLVAEAKGTDVGPYDMGLSAGDFNASSPNYEEIVIEVTDGRLEITPFETEIEVIITGNTDTVVYDSTEHSVEGYTVEVKGLPDGVAAEDAVKIEAAKAAEARGINAGTYYMGLTEDDFAISAPNYDKIKVTVNDGWLKITQITDTVTVTIVENADTVEYDGKEHIVRGYESMTADNTLYDLKNVVETPTRAWTATGTDAGAYPVGIKAGDFENTNKNFANVEFVIVDGELKITRRGENPESPVTLQAKDSTVVFDGEYHGYVGHIVTNLAEGHSVRSVKSDFAARNVGVYTDKIDLHDAIIVDANGRDVTRNYKLTYLPGTLEITPFEGEVEVIITGNTGAFRYNGMNHTVSGFTMEASVPFFTRDDIRFTGKGSVTHARIGDYPMGLKETDFSAANGNFTNVKFYVYDGGMRIYTVRYTVAWLFDTDQLLTGSEPNTLFSAMTHYIDRTNVSLVLHSGNVVVDAASQEQWDVFNNAMQPIYDKEDVDVLVNTADKEAASGSIFMDQPLREDFEDEDLFENGKGFARRLVIGERDVILVGLGADAMTEEGYKWAREKFDSDKDASGILLVNTYLLEDMTKDDKLAESALDIEKSIVKPCENVRLVLSSSGGYSSHHEFFYGERRVIAINSDIEAAAKAGYFTQLTFNEDLNILSVTNLCPYTYDFVYNDREPEKECYVLNDVL